MRYENRCSKKYKYKIQFFANGLLANGLIPSSITRMDGNQEFLAWIVDASA